MRTKVLVCAAVLAASLASSMAQNVYSLNVVGYVNVTANGGLFTFMGNPLKAGGNTLTEVIPPASVPDSTQVLTWNIGTASFHVDYADYSVPGSPFWADNDTGTPTGGTTMLPPGKGFFLNNAAGAFTMTFVGEVLQGDVTVPIAPGFNAISCSTPQVLNLSSNGFPQSDQLNCLIYNSGTAQYTKYYNGGAVPPPDNGWHNNDTGDLVQLEPAIGQGFFIENIGGVNLDWVRTFTVQ